MNFAGVRESDDNDLKIVDDYDKTYGTPSELEKLLSSVIRNETLRD